MRTLTKIVSVGIFSILSGLAFAHDPSQHHAAEQNEKPDCSMMERMHSESSRNDPVMQAMIARCAEMMKEGHGAMMSEHAMEGMMPMSHQGMQGDGDADSGHGHR